MPIGDTIDRIQKAVQLDERATDIPEAELEAHFASSYGIFGGKADKVAVLLFTEERAKWVAEEEWHPKQQGRRLGNGTYELRIPYNNSRELVMDILREGSNVVVIGPKELQEEVQSQLREALLQYGRD
jgi:proteasome accessory factor C